MELCGATLSTISENQGVCMMKKCILSRLVSSCALLALVLTLLSCSTGSSSDPTEEPASNPPEHPVAASESLVEGIYTGTYDGENASFICSGTECVIVVDGTIYAKGTFTDLAIASVLARAAGFVTNLTITEKINSDGILCTVAAPEIITFAFPPEDSTDPITITVNGVSQEITREITYFVTFDHKNNQYSKLPVKAHTELDLDDPLYNSIAKGNYSLMEWCLDPECSKPAPNPLMVDRDITLYASWDMTTIAAPSVTDLTDGISIPVDMMPEGTGGFQLFRIEADGTWNSIYYRGSGGENGTSPIQYPFVEAGKVYRFRIEFYDQHSHTIAVTNQFTVTPANGVGEISVSNGDAITLNITDDGRYWLGAIPEITGKGATAITDSWGWFEFWKGNGWESQTHVFVTWANFPTTDLTTQHDIFMDLISNPSVPLPSGSKFFMNFVFKVEYGNEEYRVFNRTSEVHTFTYDERWRLRYEIPRFAIEETATGSRITVTDDPNDGEVHLVYTSESAAGKSCTYSGTVKNLSSVEEFVSFNVYGSTETWWDDATIIPAGSEMTFSINNDEKKVVSEDGFLYVDVDGGSFEISDPVITPNE